MSVAYEHLHVFGVVASLLMSVMLTTASYCVPLPGTSVDSRLFPPARTDTIATDGASVILALQEWVA